MSVVFSYFKLAFRNSLRQKVYSFIKLFGLIIGITSFLVILQFVSYEKNYDSFHKNSENIFRIIIGTENTEFFAGSPAPLGPKLAREVPEITSFLRFGKASWNDKNMIQSNENSFYESLFYLADSNFFTFFNYSLISGDKGTVLIEPNTIVISERIAKKYFGDKDPLGEIVVFNNEYQFKITGIAENAPPNSHLNFDFIVPFNMLETFFFEGCLESWGMFNYYTYINVHEEVDKSKFKEKYNAYVNASFDDPDEKEMFEGFIFQGLEEVHLEVVRYNLNPAIEKKYLNIITAIGLIILLISSINYMNISTAISFRRAKEVGLRKVVGATRFRLIYQFLGESLFYVIIAMVFSLAFVSLLRPLLIDYFGIFIPVLSYSAGFILFIIILVALLAIVSGSYPAFYVSSYQPSMVLKSGFKGKKGIKLFRNILVVIQFFISVVLISAAIIIFKQMGYVKHMDLGLDNKNIINIPLYDKALRDKIGFIKTELENNPNISMVSANRFLPSRGTWRHGINWEGQEDDDKNMWYFVADQNFLPVFNIEIIEGRNFSEEYGGEKKTAYLVNEAAVKELGYKNPIGKNFSANGKDHMGKIIGVVKDFNFRSLHHAVEPCCIKLSEKQYDQISLKLAGEETSEAINSIREDWDHLDLGVPFDYLFIEDDFKKLYGIEFLTIKLVTLFTLISFLLSSLGLFGLVSHSAKQRRKEIGLRKILGATIGNIILIISKDYSKLVVLAFVLAIPVVFLIMSEWLNNFQFHISIDFLIFLIAGSITALISFLTVLYQSLVSAMSNPVDTLKYE